jgi:RimJ/RimL family protein N-acetyltransferase
VGMYLENKTIRLRTVDRGDLKALSLMMSNTDIARLSVKSIHYRTSDGRVYEKAQKDDERIWFLIETIIINKIIGETGFSEFSCHGELPTTR